MNTPDAAPVLIIPAYKPTPALPGLVRSAVSSGMRAVVVDDGSGPEYAALFEETAALPGVTLLRHAVNLGKGQALKTAFNHVLLAHPGCPGVVTADADGQHAPQDVKTVARALAAAPNRLCLGVRSFGRDVPWRSRFGNVLTGKVFRLLTRLDISDTQTGLRAIPLSYLPEMLRIQATRYEFELEMLVLAARRGWRVEGIPIATTYLDGNASSHFNPLVDSLKIYFVFLRFFGLSLATFLVDYAVFSAAYALSGGILESLVAARIVAGLFNFSLAKTFVFKSPGKASLEALRYVLLVAFLLVISYGATSVLVSMGLNVYLSKIVAETALFLASFAIQNIFVFSAPEETAPEEGQATDWNAYYRNVPFSARVTRLISQRLLLKLLRRHAPADLRAICEPGGANSCFADALQRAYPQADYTAVDTNAYGLALFAANAGPRAKAVEADILAMPPGIQADLTFSVGLIEHFTGDDVDRAVKAHFDCTRPGGLVCLAFPTPTWLYRASRRVLEALGMWRFHDETPLVPEPVVRSASRYGEVLATGINWPILLTQAYVLVRKAPRAD